MQDSFKTKEKTCSVKPSNNIETERLILKPTSSDDAEFIYELLNSPKWLKFIGDRNIKTIEDAASTVVDRVINLAGLKIDSYSWPG